MHLWRAMKESGDKLKKVSVIVTILKLKSSEMNRIRSLRQNAVISTNLKQRNARFNQNMMVSSSNLRETWTGNSKRRNGRFRNK